MVACAYNPMTARDQAVLALTIGDATQDEVRGDDTAREALAASIEVINTDRVRDVEQVIVQGPPAQALLDVAQKQRADLCRQSRTQRLRRPTAGVGAR